MSNPDAGDGLLIVLSLVLIAVAIVLARRWRQAVAELGRIGPDRAGEYLSAEQRVINLRRQASLGSLVSLVPLAPVVVLHLMESPWLHLAAGASLVAVTKVLWDFLTKGREGAWPRSYSVAALLKLASLGLALSLLIFVASWLAVDPALRATAIKTSKASKE